MTIDKDPRINYALRQIMNDFGVNASVARKAKAVDKFGMCNNLGTTETILSEMEFSETYLDPDVDGNLITHISSSSTADTDVPVLIEEHYVALDGTHRFHTQTVNTDASNGQTPVPLTQPLFRDNRMKVTQSIVGDIWAAQDDTWTGGVPDDTTKAHNVIRGTLGKQQTYKAATYFSSRDFGIAEGLLLSVGKKTAATVDFEVYVGKAHEGTMLPVSSGATLNTAGQSALYIPLRGLIIPRESDVYITGAASTGSVEARGTLFAPIAIDRALMSAW